VCETVVSRADVTGSSDPRTIIAIDVRQRYFCGGGKLRDGTISLCFSIVRQPTLVVQSKDMTLTW
jgi:hypothetical protein